MYREEEMESEFSEQEERLEKLVAPQAAPRKHEIVKFHAFLMLYWHTAGLYGLYLVFTSAKWATISLAFALFILGDIGLTAGVHRLWSHRSYKAKLPLQILLMIFHTITAQYTAITWIRDHRMHHKYSDTDADPHNAARGFFFSHCGWIGVRKQPEFKQRVKYLHMPDIKSNPVLKFQKKYRVILLPLFGFILPTVIPMYFWDESFDNAYHVNIIRFVMNLHVAFFVNSVAHMFGDKPYDNNIRPSQNHFVSLISLGEGFHNYHHVFPWDYRAAELGNNYLNLTTKFIDFFAWIGWAYDLKSVSDEVIQTRCKKTGDGTDLWGYKAHIEERKKTYQ